MSDDPSDDADRLERALERIAMLAARRVEAVPVASFPAGAGAPEANAPPANGEVANVEVAARLDQLIARLRATLSTAGA